MDTPDHNWLDYLQPNRRIPVFFHAPTLKRVQEYQERWRIAYDNEISFDVAIAIMIEQASEKRI